MEPITNTPTHVELVVAESAVAILDGQRTPISGITEVQGPDGLQPAVHIYHGDQYLANQIVGSILAVHGLRWQITEIVPGTDTRRGHVRFSPVA
jgi:hypothetical protein